MSDESAPEAPVVPAAPAVPPVSVAPVTLTDAELWATAVADEGANQPPEGQAAVAAVILNRMRLHYQSDGSMAGTVLHKWAFSGFWDDWVSGRYVEVAFDADAAMARAVALQAQFQAEDGVWERAVQATLDASAWAAGRPMSFEPGPAWRGDAGVGTGFGPTTVLYYAPSGVPAAPVWAVRAKLACTLWAHVFYNQ